VDDTGDPQAKSRRPRRCDDRSSRDADAAAGVAVKVVTERLGHAMSTYTIESYQHVLPGMQADAARTMEALVTGVLPRPLECSRVPWSFHQVVLRPSGTPESLHW
jgi:hypothetical protein